MVNRNYCSGTMRMEPQRTRSMNRNMPGAGCSARMQNSAAPGCQNNGRNSNISCHQDNGRNCNTPCHQDNSRNGSSPCHQDSSRNGSSPCRQDDGRNCRDNTQNTNTPCCSGNTRTVSSEQDMMVRRYNTVSEDIPTGCAEELMCYINEVSFGAYDLLLYLDTHPADQEALCYFRTLNRLRNRALVEYERMYGPLSQSNIRDESDCWLWMTQPWPWEGGNC